MTGNSAGQSASRSGRCFSSFFFFSAGETSDWLKPKKQDALAGYQQGSGLRSGVIGSNVFHFIAFVTKNSRLYFEEASRPEQQQLFSCC